ncbi:MAG TPA: hypothetical protein VLF79_02605 [Candidatus Saccharimonadales bacterium]|nr:hypothetical protein [Candidatus Saccharimonadales bacterium]
MLKPVENLGVKAAQLAGASHVPGVNWVVERHVRQERQRAQQQRLQPFAGNLVLVGGNLDEQPSTITPDQAGDRMSRVLFDEGTIAEHKPVVIRALIPDTMESDESVERGTHLINEALQRNYDISTFLIPEAQPIATKSEKYEPILDRTHRAIDATIIDLKKMINSGHENSIPQVYSHLVLMFVVRDSVAVNFLPPPIGHNTMKMGKTALLAEVGVTPQENIWETESLK